MIIMAHDRKLQCYTYNKSKILPLKQQVTFDTTSINECQHQYIPVGNILRSNSSKNFKY